MAYRRFLKGEVISTQPNVVSKKIYLSGRKKVFTLNLSRIL